MTTNVRPDTAYRACIDPLHRNTWPVRVEEGDDAPVIGYLTEHITVNMDGNTAPHVRWSWVFEDAEGDRLRVDETLRASRGRYRTWRTALDAFAHMHQLATSLRDAEAHLAAQLAKRGE